MTFEIHGYAIVSDDDRIADADGAVPNSLRNDADWAYFQTELDRAALTVLGRLGHEANPNRKRRPRLILSASARGLEEREDGFWWNPTGLSFRDAARTILPHGGRIAVPGGQQVFDLFLGIGYDAFHLSRARGLQLPGGIAIFSACDRGLPAEAVLRSAGLAPGKERLIDPAARVTLAVWRRTPS